LEVEEFSSVYMFMMRIWKDGDDGERRVMEAIVPLFFEDMRYSASFSSLPLAASPTPQRIAAATRILLWNCSPTASHPTARRSSDRTRG
jgi:hypothetical protein